MQKWFLIAVILMSFIPPAAAAPAVVEITPQQVRSAFPAQTPPHPRLLLTDAELPALRERISANPLLNGFYENMLRQAQSELKAKPLQRKQTGRRLLGVSRQCLERVLLWSMAYRLQGDPRYLRRAEKEMLTVAAFSDWNPSHFLDVAEMTAAMAIGYDWLYDGLSEPARETIRTAILEKGLMPSINGPQGYFHGHNNWTQVCNGGITLGALALMENEPELAYKVVHRAVNGVQTVMNTYEPDGAYPEGPGYWEYGTTFNVLLVTALESVLKTDFGLSQKHGFSQAAEYYLHICGPTGQEFNYPDDSPGRSFTPTVFWFAGKYNTPSVAWNEYQTWQNALSQDKQGFFGKRMAPLTLLWANGNPVRPDQTAWLGRGSNPVALFRTEWTPQAVYLGFKGGSPGVSHGHMDVGSFVLDADGVRWAVDLGPESYHKIESRGMNLWSMAPDSDRWKIFRYTNLSHNTLVVNGQPQVIDASAPMIRYSDNPAFAHAVTDMSAVYKGQLEKALRGAALLETGQVLIQDDLTAPAETAASVRWAMATPATIDRLQGPAAELTLDGKRLLFEVISPRDATLQRYPARTDTDYDASNPGITLLGFEYKLEPGRDIRLAVLMTPQSSKKSTEWQIKPLTDWSEPLKSSPR